VVETISAVDGVADVSLAEDGKAPPGTLHKGGWTDLAVKVAPAALERLGAALAALFGLPGAPLPVIEVGTPYGPVRVPYDPRHQSLSAVVTEVERLLGRPAVKPG
jgi:hypothetical protein